MRQEPGEAATQTPDDALRVRYRANTNLEQISDWLTKILVGVGLTQMNNLPDLLDRSGLYFGQSIMEGGTGSKVAVTIVLFFSISGFLFGYLWTRLLLGRALAEADIGAVAERFEKIEQAKLQQEQMDARALSLANRLLSDEDIVNFPFGELADCIKGATAPVRVQLFYHARESRRQAQKKGSDRSKIERTIPIFEALAASDTEKRFHRNYGQLGYALLDKPQPDYGGAERAFTTAIQIRGPAKEHHYEGYELNRALSRIMQDPDYGARKRSGSEVKSKVLADIDVALEGNVDFHEEEQVIEWLSLNAPEYLTRVGAYSKGQPAG
jgi:hypothetical protein